MIDVVAGVDSSTQSCTVELRDAASGALVSTGRAPHPVTHPPISEQDPESWWQALVAAMGDARRDVEVRIIGVSVGAQLIGTVMGVAWALVGGLVVYGVLKATLGLRLSAEEEYEGADISIHRIGSTPDREVNW